MNLMFSSNKLDLSNLGLIEDAKDTRFSAYFYMKFELCIELHICAQ